MRDYLGNLLEPGMAVLVKTRANNGNSFKTLHGNIIQVLGGAARVKVKGEDHPRTVRFNMLELPEEAQPPSTPIRTSLREKFLKSLERKKAQEQLQSQPQPQLKPDPQPQLPQSLAEAQPPTNAKQLTDPSQIITSGGNITIIRKLNPELAEKLLANRHPRQRKFYDNHVISIAQAMENGTYKWVGDPIRLDRDGRLIDGQHRLSAVVLSGVTVYDVIVVQVDDDEVAAYIDTITKPRSLADIRMFQGNKKIHSTIIAAVLMVHSKHSFYIRSQLTKPEQNKIVESCQYLDDLTLIYNASRTMKLTAAHISGILLCIMANPQEAMKFFMAVLKNEHNIDGQFEPMVKLTADWLLRDRDLRAGKKHGAATAVVQGSPEMTAASKLVRAYNAWRSGQVFTVLQAGDHLPEAVQ